MNPWKLYSLPQANCPSQGVSLHFEKGIDPEFRNCCISFIKWVRKHYCFPVHLNIYIKNCEKIRLWDGSMAYGGFRYSETRPPCIRIPAAISPELQARYEALDIFYSVLGSLSHELTHYFQWVAGLEQTDADSERQANYYRFRIIRQFCMDCGLPY